MKARIRLIQRAIRDKKRLRRNDRFVDKFNRERLVQRSAKLLCAYVRDLMRKPSPLDTFFPIRRVETQPKHSLGGFQVTCDESPAAVAEPPPKNEIKLQIAVPHILLEGMTAERCHQLGIEIPAEIPDCAVFKSGAFEWVKLEFNL